LEIDRIPGSVASRCRSRQTTVSAFTRSLLMTTRFRFGTAIVASILLFASCQRAKQGYVAEEGASLRQAAGMATAQPTVAHEAGAKMITISIPKGTFRLWTRKVGENPTVKILLLHGGPGSTHEYFEVFEKYFANEGFEFYYYDQLGSYLSDQPDEPELWEIPRFVDEVEQVRQALGLGKDNFYLYGQSWGGILAMEYALEHQQHPKDLIISNMMASIPADNEYPSRVLTHSM